jgi:hypothetical protein
MSENGRSPVVPAIYFTPLSKTIIEFIILQSLDRVTIYNFLLANTSTVPLRGSQKSKVN